MKTSHSFDSLPEWALPRLATPPDLAARLRIRVDDGRVSWSCDAEDVTTEAGGLAAVDWIRDNATPPCLVRMDWVDGSGAFVKTAGQRTFSLPAEERAAEEDGSPAPRPTVTAPRLGTVIDVDGVRLPLTRPDGPDPDRLLHAEAAAPGLAATDRAYLTLALAARAEAAGLREEGRATLAALLQSNATLRELARDALTSSAALATALRQTRAVPDVLLTDMLAHTLATERRAGDDRTAAAVAEVRAGAPAPAVAGEEADGAGSTAADVGSALGELRGLVNDAASLVGSKRVGTDGPTVAALRAAAEGNPEALVKWAMSASPEVRAAWVGKLGPVLAALAA